MPLPSFLTPQNQNQYQQTPTAAQPKNILGLDPASWLAISAGLLGGQTANDQLSGAFGNLSGALTKQQEKQQIDLAKNQTYQMLATQNPEVAEAVKMGIISPQDGFKAYMDGKKKPEAKFQIFPDGSYGWVNEQDQQVNIAGKVDKPESLPSEVQQYEYAKTHPEYADYLKKQKEMKDAPSSTDNFKAELETMKSYRGDDGVKTYQSTRDAYEKVRTAAQLDTAQGDIGIVYGFMKMLDPTSVVREGEFATAQNSGGVSDSVINIYNKAINGERLNPEQRRKFVEAAQAQYQNTERTLQETNARYTGLADQYGIPTERFIEVPKKYEPLELGGAPKVIDLPDGTQGTIRKTK